MSVSRQCVFPTKAGNALGVNKRFSSGIFTSGGATQVNLGYAYTDSQNARNNQSSTATSSFDATAAFDRQDPAVSRATTETRHNITAAVCSFRPATALKTTPGSRYDIHTFKWHNSAPFEWHSRQLLELGLMEPGQWF